MIYNINTTVYLLSTICDEIRLTLNHRTQQDSIADLIVKCVSDHKDQLGIQRFRVRESVRNWPRTFSVEFLFKTFDEFIEVEFSNLKTPNGFYQAKVTYPSIVISQPIRNNLDGVVYCCQSQRILFADFFTTYTPLSDEDKFLSPSELLDGTNIFVEKNKRHAFLSFYERLSEEDRNELGIANVNCLDRESTDIVTTKDYLQKRIESDNISLVVTNDRVAYSWLKEILQPFVTLIMADEPVPLLFKRQWVRRAISLMMSNIQFAPESNRELIERLNMLMKQYQISRSMMWEVCESFDGQYLNDQIKKHYALAR